MATRKQTQAAKRNWRLGGWPHPLDRERGAARAPLETDADADYLVDSLLTLLFEVRGDDLPPYDRERLPGELSGTSRRRSVRRGRSGRSRIFRRARAASSANRRRVDVRAAVRPVVPSRTGTASSCTRSPRSRGFPDARRWASGTWSRRFAAPA